MMNIWDIHFKYELNSKQSGEGKSVFVFLACFVVVSSLVFFVCLCVCVCALFHISLEM